MKKLYIIILLILTNLAYSQVTTTSAPVGGDSFFYKKANAPVTIPSLTNGIFNFSSLKSMDSSVWSYQKATSPVYPTANLLFSQSDDATTQLYMNSSKSNLYIVGMNNLPIPPEITITQNLRGSLVYMMYPFNLNSSSNTLDSISAVVPADSELIGFNIDSMINQLVPSPIPGATFHVDSIYITLKLNLQLSADNSGKITTPFDTAIDCIRIVRKLSMSPTLILGGAIYLNGVKLSNLKRDVTFLLSGFMDPSMLTQTQHLYYSPKYKSEVLQGLLDSTGTQYSTVYYRQKSLKGVNVVPPPSLIRSTNENLLQFAWNDHSLQIFGKKPSEPISIQLYDMIGRKKLDITTRDNVLNTELIEKNQLYIMKYNYLDQDVSLKLMH